MTSTPDRSAAGRTTSRRHLLLGVAIGFLVPLLSFSGLFLLPDQLGTFTLGAAPWALVAFVGVVLCFFDATRRVGTGMLLGFSTLLVVGAGACLALLAGGGWG